MKRVIVAVVCIALLAGVFCLSLLINKSAEDIEETESNDSIKYLGKITSLPDDITVWNDDGESSVSPAAWKVTAENGNVIYMTGSMHVLKDESYPLPDYLKEAYEQAEILAVETENTDTSKAISDSEGYTTPPILSTGDSLKKHLSDETYSALSDYLESNGEDIESCKSYTPWYLYDNLNDFTSSDTGYSSAAGLDRILSISANIDGKPIDSLETTEQKLNLNSLFSEELLDKLIYLKCVQTAEENQAMLDMQYEAWSSGDIDKIGELSFSTLTDYFGADVQDLQDEYNKTFVYDRNEIMLDGINKYLEDGTKVLVCVGATHYAGDKGLIALLEEEGCTCERIDDRD